MELHLLVASANKVVDDVRGRGIATGAAEPLVAGQALDDTAGVVDAAIAALLLVADSARLRVRTRTHGPGAPLPLPPALHLPCRLRHPRAC